jgi:hypothetical protein
MRQLKVRWGKEYRGLIEECYRLSFVFAGDYFRKQLAVKRKSIMAENTKHQPRNLISKGNSVMKSSLKNIRIIPGTKNQPKMIITPKNFRASIKMFSIYLPHSYLGFFPIFPPRISGNFSEIFFEFYLWRLLCRCLWIWKLFDF